jgi:excinuclease UvrABC nuclease subunit
VLACSLTFSPDRDESFFQELPAAAAVFLLRGEGEPYVSKTANLRRRLQRLLGVPPEHSKRLNLRDRIHKVEFTPAGSDFELQVLLYQLLRETFPKTYAARLRLRPAPLIKLHLENEYPRASVTTRLGKMRFAEGRALEAKSQSHSRPLPARLEAVPSHGISNQGNEVAGISPAQTRERIIASDVSSDPAARAADGHPSPDGNADLAPVVPAQPDGRGDRSTYPHGNIYYGPFPSRAAAEKFASDALDFFKMRRCVDDLHPDPTFPGCVYSEMKMCLAPCFKGCTDAEYHVEVVRVQDFFDSGGGSLTRELSEQRERASTELAFEEAASIHVRIEKLNPVIGQLPEVVRRIDRLDAIIVQRSAEPGSVCLFRFRDAHMAGPLVFNVERHTGEHRPDLHGAQSQNKTSPQTMESRVEQAIESFSRPQKISSTERMEQLAILKRWYYRSQRSGEIFIADERGRFPLRRLARGIGRVYRGEKAQEPTAFPATETNTPTS